jgi:hypothetical protein
MPSEEMMELLKELVLLKELDRKEGESGQSIEFQERQKRRDEIANQIKALAES